MSVLAKSGCEIISRAMTGTPLTALMRSRSMSCNASPASHLYMCTSLPPPRVVPWAAQLLAVTWNSGVVTSAQPMGGASSALIKPF